MRRICVFCGASAGNSPAFAAAARRMGQALVARELELVYGGGKVGLMGTIADAVLDAGGRVTGVIPRALVERELAHDRAQEMLVVASMHERKAKMAELSDAFIALPGGLGTFEEFCEALTWSQLGFHDKPCGLLDVEGYYRPLLALFDSAVGAGFVRPEHRALVLEGATPEELLDRIAAWRPLHRKKWLARGET
ncbi:MAG: TIGR00730 family Rossman fold protein [Planctomycetota bacterium]